MKKYICVLFCLMLGISAMAQQKIQLRSSDKAECVKSDMTSLKATFSFSTIEAQDYESERGTFSWLSLPNTVIGGNEGDPQIPVINELIAVPVGAEPVITVTSYSTIEYNLSDFGIRTLVPRQPSLRKDKNPEDVPFVYNEDAYQKRGLRNEPLAVVENVGTMRGVHLGRMTIEPVSYDPVNNIIRVFNDIEVEVRFDGADANATKDLLLRTYSPAFNAVYSQLFNNRAITDAYTDHPDLYKTPVKMLVICYSGFKNNSALNNWLQWKLQKGYYVDIFYTDETGTTANNIKNFIKTKYNASVSAGNAYTYLVVIGDTDQVPYYMVKYIDDDIKYCASDLGYAAVNFTTSSTSNYFPDMYYSRISVENTTHLTNYINKVLTYEKFEFADGGNYLNNVILVGGWDSNWTNRVAKPTINYATNNYFNTSNTTYGGFGSGIIHATISTSSTQGWSGTNHGCYNGLNDGVCFLNYTAHGDKQEWQGPQFTAKQVETVTNTGKYFFGVGNCCLTGNYNLNDGNYSPSYAPSSSIGATASFGETMIRVPNAGAIAYVGCSPYSYWYEDFYWAVGAHSYSAGNAPSVSSSSTGVYDVMFNDANWNSASALLYLGNLAVQQAVTNGNTNSGISGSGDGGDCLNSAHYYFQFYHTFGDGSIMPYITKPETNTVTIPSTVFPGTNSITVNALAGSYVAVTDNSSVIYGVAEANSSGVATVNFTQSIPATGTLYVVVTRQQYQPYFGTINVVGGTQYNITVNQPQHGTISAPAQAYATSTVTLTATPETGYCLSSWNVRDANDNSIAVTDNHFTMPESDVTVTATFVPGMQVTLANVQNGTISADPLYALQGMTVNLTATPDEGYEFNSWMVYRTDNPSTTVAVTGNSFIMPNYPVTVSAHFVLKPVDMTVYDGTATNQYIPMYGYYFDDFTKSECIIPATQLTEMAGGTISAITFYPSSVGSNSSTWTSTSQTVFLKEVSNTTLGGSYSGTTGATVVKQALLPMPTAGIAYTITFDTPYTYNGGNLLIGIYNTDDGTYNKVEWYGTSNLTSGVSAYGSDVSSLGSVGYNAQSFLPKTTFTYMPGTITPSYEITISANPAEGGTVSFGSKNDRGELVYDFEDGTQGWTVLKGNTGDSPNNWRHNSSHVSYSGGSAHDWSSFGHNSSSGFMLSESYISATSSSGNAYGAVTPDNYLVSPKVRLGGSISFYAGARNTDYCAEKFSVMVSTTDNTNTASFTTVETWILSLDDVGYTSSPYTVDLSAYSGMGYVAIRHWDCYDQWVLCIDDITIVEGEENAPISNVFLEGSTCTVIAAANAGYSFVNWTENDVVVSTSASYAFTVNNNRNLVANFGPTFTKEISAYTNHGGWYLISSPLAGETNPLDVNNMTSNEFDLYRFNQSADKEWENWKTTGSNYHFNLESGKGYLYANSDDVVLTFTGTPYSGNGKVTLTKDAGARLSGWNLIGNPFGNAATMPKDFYRMNADGTGFIASTDHNVAPMEGIMVYASSNGETVTFTENAKDDTQDAQIVLNMRQGDGDILDRVIVRFSDGGLLPKCSLDENTAKIFITQNGTDYAVVHGDASGEMHVSFNADIIGKYTFSVDVKDANVNYLHLIDKLANDDVDMLLEGSYTFIGSPSDSGDRFVLRFGHNDENGSENDVFAYQSGDEIIVTGEGELQVYDVMGRMVATKHIDGVGTWRAASGTGVYILKLNGKTQKLIIR